jgi:hypothetical protein
MSSVEIFAMLLGLGAGYVVAATLLDSEPKAPQPAPVDPTTDRPALEGHKNCFDLLEIGRLASVEEIRAAYQLQMSRYDPGKVAALGVEFRDLAQQRARAIEEAYQAALMERK